MMLTNPCLSQEECSSYNEKVYQYIAQQGFISDELKDLFDANCVERPSTSPGCKNVLGLIDEQLKGVNFYSIHQKCNPDGSTVSGFKSYTFFDGYKCLNLEKIQAFFKDDKFKAATHVDTAVDWKACNMDVYKQYNFTKN